MAIATVSLAGLSEPVHGVLHLPASPLRSTTGANASLADPMAGRAPGPKELPPAGAPGAVILVAGAGGGVHGPAGIYPSLASTLSQTMGYPVLRLDYRRPNHIKECLEDVQTAVRYLEHTIGAGRFAIVGWSFGGAVALRAAQDFEGIVGVATVASQTAWVGDPSRLGRQGKPLLLLHGTGDTCLSDSCSRQLYANASEPKQVRLYDGDDHGLTRAARKGQVEEVLATYLQQVLEGTYQSPAGVHMRA